MKWFSFLVVPMGGEYFSEYRRALVLLCRDSVQASSLRFYTIGMENKEEGLKRNYTFHVLGILFLCGVVVFAGYVGWRLMQGGDKPVITIISPGNTTILNSGEGLAVVITAESSVGLERVVLLVDGQTYAEQSVNNETSFNAVFPWYATALGKHTIEAVAVDKFNRSSDPAQVMVGVESVLVADVMDYEYIPPQETANGESAAAGSIVPTANGDRVIVSEDGSFDTPPTDEEIALLPLADDQNPSVTIFTAEPGRIGHQIQIRYQVEAEDDLGIDRLELSLESTITGEVSTRTTLCFGDPVCFVEDVYPFASAGVWLFQAQAIDTSGQASALQATAVEIVENPGFDPAIGILDPAVVARLIADWLRDERPRVPFALEVFEQNMFENPGFPAGALESIQMELTPGYALNGPYPGFPPGVVQSVVQTRSVIPPVAAWSGYENLALVIKVDSLDLPEEERGERFPLRGNPTSLRITDEIIANGYVFETAVWARCGGLYWDVHWELISNGQLIESGPVSTVRTAPCLPPPDAAPVIIGLQGFSNSNICVSTACTELTWRPSNRPAPVDPSAELPMTSLGVYRWAIFSIGRLDALGADPADFLNETFWHVPIERGEFIQRMPCAPPDVTLTYAFTVVPMTYIGPGETIYSNDGTTFAYIDACKVLPYDTVGSVGPR
jgi:hypothetical protein